MDEISITKLRDEEYINQIVEIHMKSFEGFFLTFLGAGFLRQLYIGFIRDSMSGIYLAQMDKHIIGFLAYSNNLSQLYKNLIIKQALCFAWYSIGAVIKKPTIMIRLIRALLKPHESIRKENYIELASIGVLPEMKNLHIGTRLVEKLKSEFDNGKFSYIKLETDAVDNDIVNTFYLKNGFILNCTYVTFEGRKMNEYRWNPCKFIGD